MQPTLHYSQASEKIFYSIIKFKDNLNMNYKLAIAALSIAVSSGCSSIVSESQYPVSIDSSPSGASYEITNEDGLIVHSGTTPSSVTLKSGSGFFDGETYTIKITKKGYYDKSYTVDSSVDGWYFGNILFGGIIGMLIVDPATGAMFSLPESVMIDMNSDDSINDDKELKITSINELTDEQKKKLVRL
ncbi:hypothetical protein L4C42_14270 [Vibrio wakamikoensis]|uniref:hypothetical protein n=1 Tax=Vibrio wakamikoensis TaxID=2910251 RepID=UPI003D2251EA